MKKAVSNEQKAALSERRLNQYPVLKHTASTEIQMGFTHHSGGSGSHHTVKDEGGDEARLLCAGVRLHQLGVVAEEALHVHAEQVRALHVVGQQHRAGHDDELEEKHVGAGEGERGEKVEEEEEEEENEKGERGTC